MEQNNIQRTLGRLESKVDGINTRLDKINGNITNHEDRINVCENFCADHDGKEKGGRIVLGLIAGGIGLIGAILGAIISVMVIMSYF